MEENKRRNRFQRRISVSFTTPSHRSGRYQSFAKTARRPQSRWKKNTTDKGNRETQRTHNESLLRLAPHNLQTIYNNRTAPDSSFLQFRPTDLILLHDFPLHLYPPPLDRLAKTLSSPLHLQFISIWILTFFLPLPLTIDQFRPFFLPSFSSSYARYSNPIPSASEPFFG